MSKATPSRPPPGYRWGVLNRVLAASVGAYVLAAVASSVLALGLPMLFAISRADGVVIGTLLSFVFHACVAIWIFATRSAWRAWAGVMGMTACLALGLYLLRMTH